MVSGTKRWWPNDGEKVKAESGGKEFVRYEAYTQVMTREWVVMPLSFADVVINRKMAKHKQDAYEMNTNPLGIALIINNEKFEKHSPRKGTEIDECNLIQTFRYLRHQVEVYHNCSNERMIEIFQQMSERDHSKYDSFACCILSHGIDGRVYGSDSKPVNLDAIATMLNAKNCKTLAGKPMMFIIQACRGLELVELVRVQADSADHRYGDGDPVEIPKEADFIFSYATPRGHASFRNIKHGSWYISELCRELCSESTHLHLDDMLKKVHREVSKYKYREVCQVPELTHRLHHNI